MKIRLLQQQLDSNIARRPDGFAAAFLARATAAEKHYEISREDLELLHRDYPLKGGMVKQKPASESTSKPRPEKKPRPTWPNNVFGLVARTIKLMRTPEEKGVGDTIARVIGPVGGDAYKTWFTTTFGKPCGCAERQENLNQLFPYETTP